MSDAMTVDELLALSGTDLGWSDWLTIDQQRIDRFSEVTLDDQFIHTDPARAAQTPFGSTIAHGFLTMSLMVHLMDAIAVRPANMVMGINYGFDRLRFISPVRVDSQVRLGARVGSVEERGDGRLLIKYDVTVEIAGEERPALVAEWMSMMVVG